MLRYLGNLSTGKLVLWCYLCWYVAIVTLHFDPSPALWISSVGMSGIIGTALLLSTSSKTAKPDGWTVFRLFLMPFCVSSYAALIKGKNFFMIFPLNLNELLIAAAACVAFIMLHLACRAITQKPTSASCCLKSK